MFPPGTWVDWFDGTVYDGPASAMVPAPLSKLPLFLAEGGIVPLLRPGIDTLSPVADPDAVDSYDTSPGVLHSRVVPGPESTFVVFDGSRIHQAAGGDGTVALSWHEGDDFVHGARFEVITFGSAPSIVLFDGTPVDSVPEAMLDGQPQGWAFSDALGGTLHVKVPSGNHSVIAKP